jgi:glycosyltransferase involved in cell wall biosynthesis
VAVFPSVREAFGLVAIEAQACGIPVVVGRAGGLPENVMEKKTGITVEGAEPSSIAAGLEYVIANRQRLAERTREFAQNYSWGRIARRYVNELYTL